MSVAQWAGTDSWRARLPHSDPQHALIWVTRGQGRSIVHGRLRGLGVHTAVVLPADHLFTLEQHGQFFGNVCLFPVNFGYFMPDEPLVLRVRHPSAQKEVTSLFEAMQREQNDGRDFLDEALSALGHQITIWLRRAIIEDEESAKDLSASQRLMAAYTSLIEQNYASGRAMQDHARSLGVSPTHLSRVSKATAGQSAASLLNGRILYAARHLLETTSQPANQIAARLGFSSAAYFSRFVLRTTGKTPTGLRQGT